MAALQHTYSYAEPSAIRAGDKGPTLALATSGGIQEGKAFGEVASPYFFQGALVEPRTTATALTTLAKVVAARFVPTPAERAAMRDPVVTSGGGLLRFEGFSGCGGVYGRLDLTESAYDGLVAAHGTTNVDFNAPMRNALVQIRDSDAVSFAVGDDEVTLVRAADQVVEKKVPLPNKWLKGFLETGAFQARMKPVMQLDRVAAVRFLRGIPKGSRGSKIAWVAPAGKALRISQSNSRGAVRVGGLERLHLLQDLLPLIKGLTIYAEEDGETCAWEIDLGTQRFFIALSPENTRSFAGEGQVLEDLAASGPVEQFADQLRDSLKWQSELRPAEFAQNWDLDEGQIERALGHLGSQGLVGYDLHTAAHFHREMPFNRDRIEILNPRLRGARKLIEEGKVEWAEPGKIAKVQGTGVVHRVDISGESPRCTCRWFTKYLGKRGVCKHILAARQLAER